MALMKCQIKNIKSAEEFETYKEFIDNEIKLLYDIRSMILSRISLDKDYSRNIVRNTLLKRNCNLDGFIMEKVKSFVQKKNVIRIWDTSFV